MKKKKKKHPLPAHCLKTLDKSLPPELWLLYNIKNKKK